MPDIKGVTFEVVLADGSQRVAHFIRPDKVMALVGDDRVTVGDFLRSLAGSGSIDISGVERTDAGGVVPDAPAPKEEALDPSMVLRLSSELEATLPGVLERAGFSPKEATRETALIMLLGMVVGYARQEGITAAFLHELLDYCAQMQFKLTGAADA